MIDSYLINPLVYMSKVRVNNFAFSIIFLNQQIVSRIPTAYLFSMMLHKIHWRDSNYMMILSICIRINLYGDYLVFGKRSEVENLWDSFVLELLRVWKMVLFIFLFILLFIRMMFLAIKIILLSLQKFLPQIT